MSGNVTFSIIKPGATGKKQAGDILSQIEHAGFEIKALKKLKLTEELAKKFYLVHQNRPFYEGLVNYMTSGPVYAMILEKNNAVMDFRKLIGATNPDEAEEGTIRKKFATSVQDNAVHGSDSDENALIESSFFFCELERF